MKRAAPFVIIVVILSSAWFFMFRSPSTPTYGGGVGGGGSGSTTTLPSSTPTTSSTTTSTILTTGPRGPNGITVKGSVDYVADQWVTNFYSEFYKWPNLLYGPNVLAKPFETPAFAKYGETHNGNLTSIGSKNAWTLLTVDKNGTYPYITSVSVPVGVGTCELNCAVDVSWTNAEINSVGTHMPPVANTSTSSETVLLTKINGQWLVSSEPVPVSN